MISPGEIAAMFALSAIAIFIIGVFLYWRKRKSGSTIKKADSAPVDLHFAESPTGKGKYIIADTETTGLPKVYDASPEDIDNWPRIVEIAWLLLDAECRLVESRSYILKQAANIPKEVRDVHGITDEMARENGVDAHAALSDFIRALDDSSIFIAHNVGFDYPVIEAELIRNGFGKRLESKQKICTMIEGKEFCGLHHKSGNGYKRPKLSELFNKCYFNGSGPLNLPGGHRALYDTKMAATCFVKMKEFGVIKD